MRVPLYLAVAAGMWAAVFVDLQRHQFTSKKSRHVTKGTGTEVETIDVAHVREYPSLAEVLASDWHQLDPRFATPAVCAWLAMYRAAVAGRLSISQSASDRLATALEEGRRCVAGSGAASSSAASKAADPAFSLREPLYKAIVGSLGMEIAPVTAIVGGLVGVEIVKLISHRDLPLDNVLLFDGQGLGGATCAALPPSRADVSFKASA